MSKDELIWIATKIFGIYLITLSFIEIPKLFVSGVKVSYVGPVSPLFHLSLSIFISDFIHFLILVVFGIYLLKKRNVILRLYVSGLNSNKPDTTFTARPSGSSKCPFRALRKALNDSPNNLGGKDEGD